MGSVWRAEHLTLHSAVAIKLMDPAIAETPEGAERFRREAQAAASLRSTHVVQVLDYGVEDGTPYLVMELLQGESLAACLERERCLTPARTLAIMTQVSRAIGRAHTASIVHRDLKPDNIFLVKEDDQEVVKVLDFGIAKTDATAFGDMKTRTGMVMGTPHYMSPEQTEGKRTVDYRTDLWAIAVIVCECMTGMQPFRGETWGELVLNVCARPIPIPSTLAAVPPGFDAWFAKATNRDPSERFGSAQELVSALRDVVEGRVATGANPQLVGGNVRGLSLASAPTLEARAAELIPSAGALVVTASTGVTAVSATKGATGVTPTPATLTVPMKRSPLLLSVAVGAVAIALGGGAFLFRSLVLPSQSTVSSVSATAVIATAPVASETGPVVVATTQTTNGNPVPLANGAAHSGGVGKPRSSVSTPLPAGSAPPTQASREAVSTNSGAVAVHTAGAASVATERGSTKTLKCYTDPFTGIIRVDGAGARPATVQTYPCKQNPFTGQYQKL
jgi:serine/threonine-protein kinase